MDPHSFIARAEAQRWIGIAEKLLISHDLVGSKTFAIRARESDPRLEAADQILAIADTLLSAEKRLVGSNGNQQPDYYAILQLVQFVQDTEHITSQYRRLAVILNPHHNRFPYSDQAFQLINDAWAVLSNPMRKSMYDSQLDFAHQQPQINNLGFNIEQQHPHQHHNPNQHHHHQQQQQQHNFFSINQELAEPQQTFQTRLQPSHQQHQQLQQHNFLSQPNAVVREQQEQLFHHQDQQEQLFQPQVQPLQVTSTPHQHTRPPPQPSQPQPPPIQSSPRPAVAATQSPFSWPQAPPLSQPQQQTQQHLQQQEQQKQTQLQQQQEQREQERQQQEQREQERSQQEQREQERQQQEQREQERQQQEQHEQERQQQEQRQKHEQQQQEPLQQNAVPVEFPSQVNNNANGVNEEETEAETEEVAEDVDDSPTFWTTCPYCFYMYEYPSVYADCTLRCDNCKRAFQAVRISSPPVIVEGQEAYFYSWGFIPIGVSMSHLQSKNKKVATSKWTPFSPLYDASNNVQNHLNEYAAPKENTFVNKSSGPRIYIDDYTDDVFIGVSEPSEDSDVEWGSTVKRKSTRMRKDLVQSFKERVQVLALGAIDPKNGGFKKLKLGIQVQEGVGLPTVPVAEAIKETVVSNNPRKQSGVVTKELGKLDLNVEFNNNEGEEPAPRMTSGTRGHGHGEEDNIEGIGFFEGLDEFLSSLPILSVVNEEKVKAA